MMPKTSGILDTALFLYIYAYLPRDGSLNALTFFSRFYCSYDYLYNCIFCSSTQKLSKSLHSMKWLTLFLLFLPENNVDMSRSVNTKGKWNNEVCIWLGSDWGFQFFQFWMHPSTWLVLPASQICWTGLPDWSKEPSNFPILSDRFCPPGAQGWHANSWSVPYF